MQVINLLALTVRGSYNRMASKDVHSHDTMPFRFFDLPRELRDQIYGYITQDISDFTTQQSGDGRYTIRFSVSSAPKLSALQVSRKFRDEYTDIIKDAAVLHVTDYNKDFPDSITLHRKESLSLVKKVDIRLLASCNTEGEPCYVGVNIGRHVQWLRTLAPALQHVLHCRIRLYVWDVSRTEGHVWPEEVPRHNFRDKLDHFTTLSIEGLQEVEVWFAEKRRGLHAEDEYRNISWKSFVNLKLYGRWRKNLGWSSS